jgi:GH15 family glucan-1,4-alpha-glucosidase
VIRTVEAVCDELCENGLVRRYRTADQGAADGLAGGEGAFLACSFWLVDNLALAGRRNEAERLLERLLDLRNDVGLLAEEYDPSRRRLVGNFPQAFSHVGLVTPPSTLPRRTVLVRPEMTPADMTRVVGKDEAMGDTCTEVYRAS